MYSLVRENIIEKNLILSGDNVLIGLSGGPDSIFLFHNLRLLKEKLSFNIYASHINHMYRGEDAFHDEEFVRSLCENYNVKLFVKRKNAAEYARELKVTEEEAGRILRYNYFKENLREIGGGKIAIAHNLNDQAETVMQRIIRGTGIDGLKAMSFKKENIVRPMLNVRKTEVLRYLKKNDFEFCIDRTNSQDIYGRNKIRLNLIPYLENNFNPNIQNTLYRMSETMENDSKIIEKYVSAKFNEALVEFDEKKLILDLDKLKSMENYERWRVIRKGIGVLKGNAVNIEMKHIRYADEIIVKGKTGKRINLSEGLSIEISYKNVIITKIIENIPDFRYNIIIGRPMNIKETSKILLCRILDASEYDPDDKKTVSLSYDKVEGHLVARNRRNGDSIIPCGMTGSKKLKDIFIDMKIPSAERDKRLVITDNINILWLEGFRIHNDYKISSSTKKILNISIMEEH